ncbi:prolyl oligopeptidase family serine peptidase [candidate division GN15 bacterium]|nr:prolyl oligopeptidase family serine peptidase [candidate division GN15 bacterium]
MYRSRNTLLVLALVLLVAASVAAQGSDEAKSLLHQGKYVPDIATFLQIGANSPAGVNWDDGTVYITSSISGSNQVYRINEHGWPYQLTTFEDGIDYFILNHAGDLAIVGADVGGSEQSQLYLMDTETGRIMQLTHYEDIQFGSVAWSKDDSKIYFRSNEENGRDFHIYEMDITTGEQKKIFGDTDGVHGYLAIGDINHDNSKMIIYRFTSNVNNELYLLDVASGDYEKLTEDDGDVMYISPTLMPDGETIWLVCNDNEDGMGRLAKMKVGSTKVEFVDDGWLDPRWEVEGLGFSRDYKHMGATINEEGYVRLRLREVETGKELPSPPLDGIIGGGMSDKDGNIYISFNGPTRAPDVWKWNPDSEELTQLTFSAYAGIDREIFSDPSLVKFESFDGLEVPAFMYLPPNYKEGEAIPFIIHAHGGPEGQFQPYFQRNIQYLILNGYGLLAVNPRGSSGYGLEYLNMDNYKNRKHSLMDYKAAVDWLIEQGYTEKGMIGIRGGSYGGYVVLGMITEYPELFSAAVDVVGIANFETFLKNTADYRRALRESEYGPLSDPEFLREVSPIHKAHLIKTPLLVVHGENDPRVPVSEARQIIAAVGDNGGVVDSLIFPDEGHGTSKRVNIIAEYRKQVEFFNRHLKKMTVEEPEG